MFTLPTLHPLKHSARAVTLCSLLLMTVACADTIPNSEEGGLEGSSNWNNRYDTYDIDETEEDIQVSGAQAGGVPMGNTPAMNGSMNTPPPAGTSGSGNGTPMGGNHSPDEGGSAAGELGGGGVMGGVMGGVTPPPNGGGMPPNGGVGPDGHGGPIPQHLLNLLQEREGWGRDTTGGQGGTLFVVNSLNNAGARTLRAALESPEPLWIIFADGLEGSIELSSSISVRSNKTLDGRGSAIQVHTSHTVEPFSALLLDQVSQVIISDINFDDGLEDWNQDRTGSHAVRIKNSNLIWVHRSRFSRWRSGAVSIAHDPNLGGGIPRNISVSWSKIDRIYQAFTWTGDLLSLGYSWCKQVKSHCVRISSGKVHTYGNIIDNWDQKSIQNARLDGELYSQGNMFVPGNMNTVNQYAENGKIKQVKSYKFGDVSFESGPDNIANNFITQSNQVGVAPGCAMDDDTCWRQTRARVEMSGPR